MALICWSPGGYVLAPEKMEGVGKVQSATYGSYTRSRENDRTENTHIDTTEVNERLRMSPGENEWYPGARDRCVQRIAGTRDDWDGDLYNYAMQLPMSTEATNVSI